ncbi:MAG: PKD domain-containing protein, partial [Candidatus Paceibacterota bacterium]
MKKYIVSFLLVALMVVPFVGQGATVQELQCQIYDLSHHVWQLNGNVGSEPIQPAFCQSGLMQQLLAQIAALQAQIVALQGPAITPVEIILPAGCTSTSGYSSTTGLPCGGSTNNISINSVSGPTLLAVNQTGTWSISATAPSGIDLTYSVDWGDIIATPVVAGLKTEVSQTSTFTHTYSRPGTYTIRFTVYDRSKCSGEIDKCVGAYAPAQATLTVVVDNGFEKGPWISGATFDSSNRTVVITGERLSQVNSGTIGPLQFVLPQMSPWVTKTNTKIVIQESKDWPTGSFSVFVSSAIGQSNVVNMTIGNNLGQPSCVLTSDKESYTLGDPINFFWSSKNATYAYWQQDTSGRDSLLLPGDKLSADGLQRVTANVVGNPSVTLLVGGEGGSGICIKTINIVASPGIIIERIFAPGSLKVGERGSWGINTTASPGVNLTYLTYSINWGESPTQASETAIIGAQGSTGQSQ